MQAAKVKRKAETHARPHGGMHTHRSIEEGFRRAWVDGCSQDLGAKQMGISRESEKMLDDAVTAGGFRICDAPFDLGVPGSPDRLAGLDVLLVVCPT